MSSTWHDLALHGFRILIVLVIFGSRFYRWRVRKAAESRPLQPPQSAPAPQPMQPQNLSLPDEKKLPPKIEGSPWSSSDPFK